MIAAAYYDPRHANFVKAQTGCAVADLAHQVGARAGTDDYFAMCEYNAKSLAAALGQK